MARRSYGPRCGIVDGHEIVNDATVRAVGRTERHELVIFVCD